MNEQDAQTIMEWASDSFAIHGEIDVKIVQELLRSYPNLEVGTLLSSYLDTFGLYP